MLPIFITHQYNHHCHHLSLPINNIITTLIPPHHHHHRILKLKDKLDIEEALASVLSLQIKDAWQPRVQVIRKTLSTKQGQSSQQRKHTLSIDDTDASRKTSITSLPRKISQASNIFFPSSNKKSANLNPADSSGDAQGGRKGSNVSVKDVIPLSSMQEWDCHLATLTQRRTRINSKICCLFSVVSSPNTVCYPTLQ